MNAPCFIDLLGKPKDPHRIDIKCYGPLPFY